MKIFVTLLLAVACCAAIFPQDGEAMVGEGEPEPYSDEEFPDWLKAVRRAEILALGSLPITFTFSFLAYDVFRYIYHGFDGSYLPIGSPNPAPYTPAENVGVLVAAGTGSILIAIADFLIGRSREKRRGDGESADLPAQD